MWQRLQRPVDEKAERNSDAIPRELTAVEHVVWHGQRNSLSHVRQSNRDRSPTLTDEFNAYDEQE